MYSLYDVGEYSYGRPLIISFNNNSTCKIWKFCSIANGVQFLLNAEHRTDRLSTYPPSLLMENYIGEDYVVSRGDIIIGNDVWIGINAIIMSGVAIGDGAIVAAWAVVTKDVAPYEIVWWIPARHIKFRFSEYNIEKLLQIKRWNRGIEKVKDNHELIFSINIDNFIAIFESDENN